MKFTIELSDEFSCSIDRAFKAPILGDATKFLNGYLFQPQVIGFEDDETWGELGGVRYPIMNGNLFTTKGRIFTDKIIEKEINKVWKWIIYDFKIPMMFFAEKAIGEWEVKSIAENKTSVRYSYTYYSKNKLYHLFTIIFSIVQWKGMMKKAIKGIKKQAESSEPFIYEKNKL
jgi:hypothetical protein